MLHNSRLVRRLHAVVIAAATAFGIVVDNGNGNGAAGVSFC